MTQDIRIVSVESCDSQGSPPRYLTAEAQLYEQSIELRYQRLRKPLRMPKDTTFFEFESELRHYLALASERVVGSVSLHKRGPKAKLLQMAVATSHEGIGLGKRLVTHLEDDARPQKILDIFLHARAPVCRFYQKLGYAVVGEAFEEVGIKHFRMEKQLSPQSPAGS